MTVASKRNTTDIKYFRRFDSRAAIPVGVVLVFFVGYTMMLSGNTGATETLNSSSQKREPAITKVNVTTSQVKPLNTTVQEPSAQNLTGSETTSSPQTAGTTEGSAIANSGIETPEAASTDNQNTDPLSLLDALDSSNVSVTSSAVNTSLSL